MARPTNIDTSIGRRIGQLLRQYALRINFAEGKAKLYDEESQKASAMGYGKRTIDAAIARNVWQTYAKNLKDVKAELENAVKEALAGYTQQQKIIWWSYFINNQPCPDIAERPDVRMELRTVYRVVKAMRDELELKFKLPVPSEERVEIKEWSPIDLALFLEEKPSDEYIQAIKDMLDYGIVDLDTLEFDHDFQHFLETGEHPL